MMGGVRVDPGSLYDDPRSLGDLDAFDAEAAQRRRLNAIMGSATAGESLEPYLTPRAPAPKQPPLLQRLLTPARWETRVVDDLFGQDDLGALDGAPAPATPPAPPPARSQPKPQPSRPTSPKHRQALAFAKVLGFVGGDDPEVSPEYAEAVSRAFARMTRGMSVAKLLYAAKRGSVQDEFQRLVSEEATKLRAAQSNSRGSTPSVSRRSIPI